jgi:hypothetical protein
MLTIKEYPNWLINEGSISSLPMDDVINKKFLDIVLSDSYNRESLIYQYMHEEGISDESEVDEEEFSDWVKYELDYLASEFITKVNTDLIKNGKIKIWRAMSVNKEWESRLQTEAKHLGIYWSWDQEGAEPHWGYNMELPFTTIMEAEVDETSVDWYPTIRLNTEPVSFEEKEIRLVKGAKIKIVSIKIDDKEIDLSDISGDRFIA